MLRTELKKYSGELVTDRLISALKHRFLIKEIEGRELERIKQDDRTVLKALYKKHRSPFMRWAEHRYTTFSMDIPDIYQQAFTIFYFNVRAGKFTGIDCTIQTYLFGIGKNLLNKKISTRTEMESLDNIPEVKLSTDYLFEREERSHRKTLVKAILDKIGEPCKTILTRYYFDNFSMEAIAIQMGYKTAMVAKKKKCECLIRIRKAMKERGTLNQEKE